MSAPKLRKFLTETRAATAVEFAMIGTVLFVFLFALLLMGVSQFWQMTLDDAVRNAARQVALGAESPSSSGDHSGSDFVASVCGEFGASVVNCSTNLQYSVQEAATFSAITPATVSADGTLTGANTFSNGVSNEPILVQVAFKLPFNIAFIPASLLTLNGTNALISAEAVVGEPSQ